MTAYEIPSADNIFYLPVARLAGASGRLVVYWRAEALTADFEDFSPTSGNISFQDGQVNGIPNYMDQG